MSSLGLFDHSVISLVLATQLACKRCPESGEEVCYGVSLDCCEFMHDVVRRLRFSSAVGRDFGIHDSILLRPFAEGDC